MSAYEDSCEAENHSGSSMDDLNLLSFPPDIDWSSTLVLRCDPSGCPYKMIDVLSGLFNVVRRNEVFNVGPTVLNHAYTISFKSTRATENFIRFLKNPKSKKDITVRGLPCLVSRVPSKCVTVHVRWIPMDVDSVHVVDVLKKYGTIVKTELIKSNIRGWFHVYTSERKFLLHLNQNVNIDDLPFSIDVKGLLGAVFVDERKPKCLECYYSGHVGDECKYEGCLLYNYNT